MPVVKLSEDEISKLKELQQRYQQNAYEVGEITIQLHSLNKTRRDLEQKRDMLLNDYDIIFCSEAELAQILSEKYGTGTINIETGEIITE